MSKTTTHRANHNKKHFSYNKYNTANYNDFNARLRTMLEPVETFSHLDFNILGPMFSRFMVNKISSGWNMYSYIVQLKIVLPEKLLY